MNGPIALGIHGGCGTLAPELLSPAEWIELREHLAQSLRAGWQLLQAGGSAVDAVEAAVVVMEESPHFNAGHGAALTDRGEHELDASIMEGGALAAGAVCMVRRIRHPIRAARAVMERTRHVLLLGDGAEQFATLVGVERVPNEWFDTERRRKVLEEVLRERKQATVLDEESKPPRAYGTVGCVALDAEGRLAAATSTGGLTGKRWGRVGDTPILGAGNWADAHVAVSGTGTGEQFIRHAVARTIAARMQFGGESLDEAANAVVQRTLSKDDGGVVAIDRHGRIATPYNSDGMYRGMADASGRFEARIHED